MPVLLSGQLNDLHKLEQQIAELEIIEDGILGQLADVRLSLKRLRARAGKIQNRTTPVYSLPDEILSIIFKTAFFISSSAIGGNYKQITVSHVSHHWRRVALDMRSLWSHIRISTKQPVELFDLYLQRSGSYLLDLRIYFDLKVSRKTIKEYSSRIIHEIDRLAHIFIEAESSDEVDAILFNDLKTRRALCLRSFEFHPEIPPGAGSRVLSFIEEAPRLSKLSFTLAIPSPPQSRSSLTHLILQSTEIDHHLLHRLLSSVPHLQTLHVNDYALKSGTKLVLPSLKTLTIGHGVRPFLETFQMPLLESLDLMSTYFEPAYLAPLADCLLLHSLTLRDSSPSLRAAGYIPHISRLTLYTTHNLTNCLKSLTGRRLFWPRLDTICIHVNWFNSCSINDQAIINMVSSRAVAGHPIKKLCCELRKICFPSEEVLGELERSGVQVELHESVDQNALYDLDKFP